MRIPLAILLVAAFLAQRSGNDTESSHRRGPHGLEAWTINYPVTNNDIMPRTLVIARNGHVLHRIDGQPLIFTWMFQDDGVHIAYSTGPLHFEELCLLIDTASGKQLGEYDCFHDPIAPTAPSWVKLLINRELGH